MRTITLGFRDKKPLIEMAENGNLKAEIYEWPKFDRFDVIGLKDNEVVMYSSAMSLDRAKTQAKKFVEGVL